MIKDEKMKQVWEAIIETNKKYLQTHDGFTPVCFLITPNYHIETMMMVFNNNQAKEIMKQKIKKVILSKRLRGYILCMDTKITEINMTTGNMEQVSDALIHNLFTPKESIVHVIVYDPTTKEITKEYEENQKIVSDWNVWDYEKRTKEQEKIVQDYFDFKEKNPDKYKGVLD